MASSTCAPRALARRGEAAVKAAQQQQQEARLRVRLVLLSLGLLRLLLMRPNLRPGSLPALPAMQEPQLLHDPIFEYSRTVLSIYRYAAHSTAGRGPC